MTQEKIIENVQAIAFDLDGTLCDSIPDLANAANAMRTYLGKDLLEKNVIESFVGDGMATLVHRAITQNLVEKATQNEWDKGFEYFIRYYREHICDETKTYPETESGLALLKSLGIPLIVITNKNEILAVELLKKLELLDYFSLVLGADSLPEKKPSALPLIHSAEVLNVTPSNMLMVGDSKNDILSAKAAGSTSIGVTFGYGDMQILSQNSNTKPDLIIQSLPEIYEHLLPKKEIEN